MIFPKDTNIEEAQKIFRTIQSVPKDELELKKNQIQSNFWASSIFILLFTFAMLSLLNMQSDKKVRPKSSGKN